jgi:hypothetical protein
MIRCDGGLTTGRLLMFKQWKLVVVAASLLIGNVAVAGPTDRGSDGSAQRGMRDGDGRQRRAKMLAKFDANKDGKLDATERARMQKAKFAKLDTNRDGVLSFDEAQPLLKHRGRQRGAEGRYNAGKKQR